MAAETMAMDSEDDHGQSTEMVIRGYAVVSTNSRIPKILSKPGSAKEKVDGRRALHFEEKCTGVGEGPCAGVDAGGLLWRRPGLEAGVWKGILRVPMGDGRSRVGARKAEVDERGT